MSCADSIQFCCCLLLKCQLFLSIELSISVRFALLLFKIVSDNGDCLVCKCFRAIIFGSFFLLAFDRLAHSNKMVNIWFHSKISTINVFKKLITNRLAFVSLTEDFLRGIMYVEKTVIASIFGINFGQCFAERHQ